MEIPKIAKWVFDDEITEMPEVIDLGDIKFLDEGVYEVEVDPAILETPQTTTWENAGTLTLYFPDGRKIENPSPEEVLEWAKGAQIPVYVVDESEDTQ